VLGGGRAGQRWLRIENEEGKREERSHVVEERPQQEREERIYYYLKTTK